MRVTASPAVRTAQSGRLNVSVTVPSSVAPPIMHPPKSLLRTPVPDVESHAEKLGSQQVAAYADGITSSIARCHAGPFSSSGTRRNGSNAADDSPAIASSRLDIASPTVSPICSASSFFRQPAAAATTAASKITREPQRSIMDALLRVIRAHIGTFAGVVESRLIGHGTPSKQQPE